MALFNYATKEITLKIVYYGPGLSGKTTNLQYLHDMLDNSKKGKLISLATETDRTLFFDFLPVDLGKLKDFSIRFQLYTVPGQVKYNSTRRIVLKGADAIVFVADSQKVMKDANIESLENMKENLIANNLDADEVLLVFQYNKRDLPNIMSVYEMNRDLNPEEQVYLEAQAVNGVGVEETFQTITKMLIKSLSGKHRFDTKPSSAGQPSKASTISKKPISTQEADAAQAWQRSVPIEEVLKEIKEKEYKTPPYQETAAEQKPIEPAGRKSLRKKYEEPVYDETAFEKSPEETYDTKYDESACEKTGFSKPAEERQIAKPADKKPENQESAEENIYEKYNMPAGDKPAFEKFTENKSFERNYPAEAVFQTETSQGNNLIDEDMDNSILDNISVYGSPSRKDEKFDVVIEKLKEITQVLISIRVSLKGIQDELRGVSGDSSKEADSTEKSKAKRHWLKFK